MTDQKRYSVKTIETKTVTWVICWKDPAGAESQSGLLNWLYQQDTDESRKILEVPDERASLTVINSLN